VLKYVIPMAVTVSDLWKLLEVNSLIHFLTFDHNNISISVLLTNTLYAPDWLGKNCPKMGYGLNYLNYKLFISII